MDGTGSTDDDGTPKGQQQDAAPSSQQSEGVMVKRELSEDTAADVADAPGDGAAEAPTSKPAKAKGKGKAKAKAPAAPKAKKAASKPAKGKAAPKAKAPKPAKAKASKPKGEKLPLDKFGFREGSIKSKAAAMYADGNGATLAEVKKKLGSVQLNLLKELEGLGFKVTKKREAEDGKRPSTRYKLSGKASK